MKKQYNADDLVVARIKPNFQGFNQETRKYIFVNKYSRILDIPFYKSILTKKKYFSSLYAHYAGDFYLTNIESYTNYFPEYCGQSVDEETLMFQLEDIRSRDLRNEKAKELSKTNCTVEQEVLDYCIKNNQNSEKISAKSEVIGTISKEKKELLKLHLTREELTGLLEGKSILVKDINTPIEISMKEDVYSSLEKNKDSLKENSKANKRKVKKREKI